MSKYWLIARYEFWHYARQKRFFWSIVSVPLAVALFIGLIYVLAERVGNKAPVGIVDAAGLLADPLPAPVDDPDNALPFLIFASEMAAQDALMAGELQVYYVIDRNYEQTRLLEMFYVEPPSDAARRQFWNFLQINLARDLPEATARRVAAGSELVTRTPDGRREFADEPTLGQLIPIFSIFAFLALYWLSASYYTQAIVGEKENRTMEVIITSASATQVVAGKALGIFAINVVQVLTWIVVGIVGVLLGREFLDIALLQDAVPPPGIGWQLLAIYLPAYILYAALMITAGAIFSEGQEAGQLVGPLSLFVAVPMSVMPILIETPHSPVAVALSLFPLTAPSAMAMRNTMAVVPVWQIFLSSILTLLTAAGAIWLAALAFRLGMLRYGQKVGWRELRAQLASAVGVENQ